MKLTKLIVISLLALIGLSNSANAQSYEVLTGPFLDSTNYFLPPSSLKKTNGTINITNYKQCGESWSNNNLGTCTNSVCVSGCAMTVAAIFLKANSVNVDPGQLNTWLTNNGGYQNGCDINWTIVQNYPGATLTWVGFYKGTLTQYFSMIKSNIDAGNPVIVHVDHRYNGTVTDRCSHFVVAYGYNNFGTSSSDFLVSDPGTTTCPTGCNLSYYSICSDPNGALRLYNNVTSGGGCSITNTTPTLGFPGSSSSPGTTISTTTPTLSWNPVAGATNYDVYVSISPYGSSNIKYEQICVSGTSLKVPAGYLINGNQYRWNIQANVSCGSCVSLYSSPLYFQTSSTSTLTVTPTSLTLGSSSGSTGIFSISSNTEWGITDDASWLTASPVAGRDAGTITLTANSANTGSTSRIATVRIEGTGVSSKTVTVTQTGANLTLSVNPTSLSIGSSSGSTGTFSISSNTDWGITDDASWLTASPVAGSYAGSITVTANSTNTSSTSRIATVRIEGTGVSSKTVTVTQTGANLTLIVNPTSLSIGSASGSTGNFSISSNTEWSITDDASWLTASPVAGSYAGSITVTANSTNTSSTSRIATVTITGTGVNTQYVTITQDANSTCNPTPSPTSAIFTSSGGTGSFNITVGEGCFWNIYNSCSSMLTNINPTEGNGPTTVTYNVLPNESASSRNCKIHIQQNNASYTITQQETTTPVITVSTNSLSDFGEVAVGQNSSSKSYYVSASDLTNNLIIEAAANFEISDNSLSDFTDVLVFYQSSGTLEPKTIYVRFKPTGVGSFNGIIKNTSNGATKQDVSVSGVGITAGTAPTITSTPVTSAVVGQLYSYDVNATGNPAPTFSFDGNPGYMTIDSTSGLIQWVPIYSGGWEVIVRASNGVNPDAIQPFTINVKQNQPIITVQPVSQPVNEGETAIFSVTATCSDPIGYQWWRVPYVNSESKIVNIAGKIEGAQTSQLKILNTSSADNNTSYLCEVYNTVDHSNLWINSNSVTLTVIQLPKLEISSGSVAHDFGNVEEGNNPTPDTYSFTIKNTGGGTLTGNVSENASWFSLSPTSFSLTANQTNTIIVTATTTSLSVGSYAEIISVTSNGGNVTGNISIMTTPDPQCLISVLEHNFGNIEKGTDPSPNTYSFTIKNTGGGVLTGNISENASWLSLSSTSLSLNENETQIITITASTTSLETGIHLAHVSVSTNGGCDTSGTISLSIYESPKLIVSNGDINHQFGSFEYGNNPYPNYFSFELQNAGGGTLTGSINLKGSWLSIDSKEFNLLSNQAKTFNISANTTNLEIGSYIDTISVNSNGGNLNGEITCNLLTGVEDLSKIGDLPKEYYLGNNYPNPFNPSTIISFGLPEQSTVSLVVYDIGGKVVETFLQNEGLPAGSYQYSFDSKKLASGIYFYTIEAGKFKETKKMLFMK